MSRLFLILYLVLASCTQVKDSKNLSVNVDDRIYENSLLSGDGIESVGVTFSQKGAGFNYGSNSYLKIDSLSTFGPEAFNISFWFQCTGDNAADEQMLFVMRDTLHPSKKIKFWLAGRRLTGDVNTNNLWAKEYAYKNGGSRSYYDLFQLEVGKYYFLSINIKDELVALYVNGELYALYENVINSSLLIHQIYLGLYVDINNERKYQFQGYIRNLTIFDKILNVREIEALSLESYGEIQPYNDTFELSKFKIDSLGQN